MKRVIARRGRVVALLVLTALVAVGVVTVTASASTQRNTAAPTPTCSLASVAGAWGDNFEGWNTQGVLNPFAGSDRFDVDSQGNLSGTESTSSSELPGGGVATMSGTITVNADCTGTLTAILSDQSTNNIRRQIWAVVYVDNQTAIRASLVSLAFGPSFFIDPQTSGTLNANKLFPPSGQ